MLSQLREADGVIIIDLQDPTIDGELKVRGNEETTHLQELLGQIRARGSPVVINVSELSMFGSLNMDDLQACCIVLISHLHQPVLIYGHKPHWQLRITSRTRGLPVQFFEDEQKAIAAAKARPTAPKTEVA